MKILPAKKVELNITKVKLNNTSVQNSDTDLDEYSSLQLKLFTITISLSGIIFLTVWAKWGLSIALNYLLGACVGVVYLRMLAKGIDQLGKQRKQFSYSKVSRFVLITVLIVAAIRSNQLHILPVFLGFLTYKAAILVYTIQYLARVRST